MNVFKSLTLTWWQLGLFKLGLLALGVLIGSHWSEVFGGYTAALAIIAALTLVYVTYLWLRAPE